MLKASAKRISELPAEALVLDVGGWAKPLPRADWVIDLMPHEGRGLYGYETHDPERFDASTWVQRDICAAEPWPFHDDQFDFAVCSHTLEDVRDPVRVCGELARVARAGYIEVPARVEEQAYGLQGEWAGWSHHRWIVEVAGGAIEFVGKPGVLHGRARAQVDRAHVDALTPEERTQQLWWTDRFEFRERIFMTAEELDPWLETFDAPRRRMRRILGRRVR